MPLASREILLTSPPSPRGVCGSLQVVGESVAMRVEVDFEGDKNAAGLFVHPKLSEAMGYSVAAFAQSILTDGTAPGVWYPEEKEVLPVT